MESLGPGGPGDVDLGGLLSEAADAIHRQTDLTAATRWVLDRTVQLTAADAAGFWYVHGGSPAWTTTGSPHLDPSVLGDLRSWPVLLPALDEHRVVRLDDLLSDSGAVQLRRIVGGAMLTIVPVSFADESTDQGALVLMHRQGPPLPPEVETAVAGLADHLAVAIDHHTAVQRLSELEASQRSVVRQLQEAVFTPAPTVVHTELGMHYVASDEHAPTGGDLFDWVVLPDGNLHLAVVDIMGKGVAATKDALAVTHALRLLVLEGCPLEDLVARADQLAAAHNPDLVATLVVGRYDPETGLLRLAGGGHPPPLLISNGTVREISAPGIPIGWPGAGSFSVAEVTLDRADTVVLYTDGLIESTKDIVEGLERLAEHAADTAAYPAPNLARALVDRALRGVARHDDSLALVLRRRMPPPQEGKRLLGPFEHRFTPSPAAVTLARHLLGDWLIRLPVEGPAAEDILLIASELSSNAMRHASGEAGSVALRASASGTDVVLEVEDDGGGVELPDELDAIPDLDAERGRGLFLVDALSDEVSSESWAGHTVVRAVKRAVIAAAESQAVDGAATGDPDPDPEDDDGGIGVGSSDRVG
jgi:serine phosphatase RsbU (regulator of sigma subunit)/anti-sigma regulatory factor (Ser/Thr protein kinase)